MKKSSKNDYPKFETWKWATYTSGVEYSLDKFLEENKENEFVFIGTDSKTVGKVTAFTSAIVAYKRHVGGKILIHKSKVPSISSMRQRLVVEAMRSLECAWYMDDRSKSTRLNSSHRSLSRMPSSA